MLRGRQSRILAALGLYITFRRAEAGLYSLPELQKLQVVSHLAMDRTPLLVHS